MSILKVSLEDYTKYKYKKDLFNPRQEKLIKKKFKRYSKDLESGKGVRIGNLDRVLIPKKDLSAKELTKGLGFLPTRIAVPESGQTKFRTFRHPHSKHHIHSHRKYWTMHKDEHTSYTTMGWAKKLKKNPSMKKYEAGLPSTVDRNTTKASSTVEAFAKGNEA